ncbi:hypothetical protein DSAG12_01565 [Promethearchaeum syntrophicum]|uniref:Uncharacterized protein n=1 Tax=Promethearchaeum syntrophicum TaxID=2594042 RepID=A0A5B9D8Z3_9ARCH|nr:hypothetical protein [Candidatus Prometheoarchaeum syntrophicum]QEE15738.1 hypothetical protein DSAG12_01565 [Candidatus Prometheoarchaeum syntrophicum]
MWGKDFSYFHDLWKDIRLLLVFNTLKANPDGLTYYDLKKIGKDTIPTSKIYRMMNNLFVQGLLTRNEEQNDQGRPRYKFFISDLGQNYYINLKEALLNQFEYVRQKMPEVQKFDGKKFIDCASFHLWQDPITNPLKSDISIKQKLEFITQMESKLQEKLEFIRKRKVKLEKLIEKDNLIPRS